MIVLIRSSHIRPSVNSQISTFFLQLPSSYRSFHASPRPQLIEAGINAAHTLFEGLHFITGLHWAYTLPIAALTIRTTFVLPLAIYSRRANQKQVTLTPLIQAWQHQLRKETMRQVGHLGPVVAHRTLLEKTRKKRKEIYKRFDCPLWTTYLPLVQLPIWLTAIETVRRMCGKEAGLLGMLAAKFKGSGDGSPLPKSEVPTGIPIEESFAIEGALWFPDLLVPDPQMILPFMLSAAILLNLSNAGGKLLWQRRLTKSMRIVALAIGPLTLQVPCAMLVYWISSSMLAYTQGLALDRLMPIKLPVTPCKPHKPASLPGGDAEDKL